MSDDMTRLVEAIAFAAHEHRHQLRKDHPPTPYINHPIALLRILAVEAEVTDVDVLIAALLHDYLEDCCGDQQQDLEAGKAAIEERFGDAVLGYVCEVTDDKTIDKQLRKALQVEKASGLSQQAKLVKLADKIANLRDVAERPPHDWTVLRRAEYFEWASQVVAELKGTHQRLEELFSEAFRRNPANI